MESSEDKQWASKYLLDPLNAPQPSDETGPGTHYGSTFAAQTTGGSTTSSTAIPRKTPSTSVRSSGPSTDQKPTPSASTRSSNNPYRNGTRSSNGYPTPPQSASPRKDRFSNISEPFPDFDGSYASKRQSVDQASTQIPTSTGGQASTTNGNNRRRTSSLNQRYPGDQTHRPLDMLMEDNKKANRAPHLRKKHLVGADAIDRLDNLIAPYHHEGPYDATLLARNTSYTNSPVEAVSTTNEEALKATPREMIKDSVERHRPLDGTAMVPPGMADRYGNTYNYQEGTDMMIEGNPEGGAYKRWPGVKYLPEDLKGKGEPSYSLEKALKEHKAHTRNVSEGNNNGENGIEMVTPAAQRRPLSDGQSYADWQGHVRRTSSGAGKLRKRFGSLKVKGRKD
ncbi:hypothetical protein JMJ35_001652 [Cladonia borealis]|uniref:Pal1 cell morphology protein n=1 Tax=Cladonia borealis TaxID=184061 RepID=A0AA39R962_9LECA|nr:hypothetical protein JMJ35_001652 [Cladonia borealis]